MKAKTKIATAAAVGFALAALGYKLAQQVWLKAASPKPPDQAP